MTHLASPCFCLFFVFWTSACLGWRWWLGKCLRNVEGQAVISNCNPGKAQHSAIITIIWWDFPVLSAKLSSSELGFHFSMTRLSVWELDRMWWWLPKCLGGRYVSSGVGFVSTVSTPTLNTSHQSPDGASPASCETRPVEMKSPRRPALLVFLLVVEDSLGMGADQAYCRLSPQHTLCRWYYHPIQIQNLEFDKSGSCRHQGVGSQCSRVGDRGLMEGEQEQVALLYRSGMGKWVWEPDLLFW